MAMAQRIKWRRLKRLAEAAISRTVAIHCSTEIPIELRAAADIYAEHMDIVLNLQHVKSEEDVIRAVAHELAHAIENSERHGEAFDRAWAKLYDKLREDYLKD